ncbi:MAG: thiopurine S-methyltransferase [Sneathiella sp.]
MEAQFWHQKWEDNSIAFHEGEANSLLVQYFEKLSVKTGSRIFVPLCGKTRDIAWLMSLGYQVAGAELSELAIKQLFDDLMLEPSISSADNLKHYHSENIDIFVGDFFDLSRTTLGLVDAVYDRAALVALPQEMRQRYTSHLAHITGTAPQLLITFTYNQNQMAGPPFSISSDEISTHYDAHYTVSLQASTDIPGGLKGQCAAVENALLLQPIS